MWFEKKLLDVASEVCSYTKGKPRLGLLEKCLRLVGKSA